jgi:hypothetical protein
MLERAMLMAADRLLYAAHVATMLFIAFGWLLPETRLVNWYLIVLTFLSWSVLGWVFRSGYGFCFLTGIQSLIRRRLGEAAGMDSFVHDMVVRVTGREIDPRWVGIATHVGFYLAAAASAYVNFLGGWST